jgi:hypothetical protein
VGSGTSKLTHALRNFTALMKSHEEGSTRHAAAMDVEDEAAEPLTARHFPSIFHPLQTDDWPSLSSYCIVSPILQRLTEPLKF